MTLRDYDDLERWKNDLPHNEREEAMALWETRRDELASALDASEELSERLFILTLQLYNSAAPEDRERLIERALTVQRVERFAASHRSALAVAAARRGDFSQARRWLAQCDANPDHILADGAYRIGHAFLALMEGDHRTALVSLGENYKSVTLPNAYRVIGAFYRVHALRLADRTAEAEKELGAFVLAIGVREAESYVERLPTSWQFDTTGMYGPLRSQSAFSGGFKLFLALVIVGAAICMMVALVTYERGAFDSDTVAFALTIPAALALGGWHFHGGWRLWRIAKRGRVVIGHVSGRVATAWARKHKTLHRVVVEAEIGGDPICAESMETFGSDESEAMLNEHRSMWVIWHPDYPRRASVVRRDVDPLSRRT